MPTVNNNQVPHSANNPADAMGAGKKARKVGQQALSKDDFLKIFMTQLKTQNPLQPFDSSSMLQQMSQLTSLSATEELQKTIQGLNQNLGKSQVLAASQLIGRKVQVPSDISRLTEGEGLSGSVILPQEVKELTITIKDSNNNIVATIPKGPSKSGVVDFSWDGLDGDKKPMPPGIYNISASTTINGKKTDLLTAGSFKVGSVALNPKDGGVILNVDDIGGISMNDIIKII